MTETDYDKFWSPAFDNMHELVFIINDKSELMKVNKSFLVFVGKEREGMLGRKICEVLYGADVPSQDYSCQVIFDSRIALQEEFYDLRLKKWLEVYVTPLFSGQRFLGSIILAGDIAGRKKVERQLQDALQAKSIFTSMVSHELRTPLTAIKEGIGIVLDETAGILNPEQKEFLGIAKRNVDRLARLINNVLDFQKIESGRMIFHPQENNVNEVAEEVRETMLPLAEQRDLDIILKLNNNLPKAVFDKDKVNQVLSNLVHNAIKCTKNGSITITTSLVESFAQVSVIDTGKGIKQEDLQRLFKQFEQLEDSCEKKTPGTGLGLAISRQIIEFHKGRIWAESEIGKGSTFSFTLPIK